METSERLEKSYCAVNFYSDQFIFRLQLVDLTANIIWNYIKEDVAGLH